MKTEVQMGASMVDAMVEGSMPGQTFGRSLD